MIARLLQHYRLPLAEYTQLAIRTRSRNVVAKCVSTRKALLGGNISSWSMTLQINKKYQQWQNKSSKSNH
jgi:hypothetical protein